MESTKAQKQEDQVGWSTVSKVGDGRRQTRDTIRSHILCDGKVNIKTPECFLMALLNLLRALRTRAIYVVRRAFWVIKHGNWETN